MRLSPPTVALLTWLVGCENEGPPSEPEASLEVAEILANASFNVAIQSSDFGQTLGRCEVQVAFYEPDEDDGYGDVPTSDDDVDNPDAEDTAATESEFATVIPRAENPGECAYGLFDLDAEPTLGALDVRGSMTAGDEVLLSGDESIPLQLAETPDGAWRYAMSGCTQDSFPFSRTFGVQAEGDPDGVPAFSLTEAVAVGPDFEFDSTLGSLAAGESLVIAAGEDLDVGWVQVGDTPSTSTGPIDEPEMHFSIVTYRSTDNRVAEALGCAPDAYGRMHVPAETLAELTRTRELGDEVYTSLQLDVEYTGDEVDTPWGELLQIRSKVSKSGRIELQ